MGNSYKTSKRGNFLLNTSYFKTQTQCGLQGYKHVSTVQMEATEKGKIPTGWRAGVGLYTKNREFQNHATIILVPFFLNEPLIPL